MRALYPGLSPVLAHFAPPPLIRIIHVVRGERGGSNRSHLFFSKRMKLFYYGARGFTLLLAFLFVATLHTTLFAQTDSTRFYYYQKQRISLTVNPNLVAVQFSAATGVDARRAITTATDDVDNFDTRVSSPVGDLVWLNLRAGRDPIASVARFTARPGVTFASPVYDMGKTQLTETNEFLARFPKSTPDAEIARINASNNVSLAGPLPNSDRVLRLVPNAGNPLTARELANRYVEAGVVEFAEPNFVIRAPLDSPHSAQAQETGALTPNDSNFNLQWGLKNTHQFQGSTARADINAPRAWGITQGASSIKIAVIDEGVDSTNPDLAGKVLTGFNSLNNTDETEPNPNDFHGTAVAGVAAANSNNSTGIAGVCWFCQILPVKVAERDSAGNWTATTLSLSSGIDWAWQHGADILNNSWTMTAFSDSVQTSILNARFAGRGGKGSTVLFASGNENAGTVSFPASLNSYVIAVGASNWCDQRKSATNNACNSNDASWGSNYGTALDLVAPGEDIYTTCNGSSCLSGNYTYLGGTSLATPFVSGIVGLIYSLNPNLTPDKVQQALQNGAKDIGAAGKDSETGYGRADAYRTLTSLYNLQVSITNHKPFAAPGETIAYALFYANTGSTAMGSTQLSVVLPANTTYVSSTPTFTAQGGGVYTLNLGTLASNQTGNATFRVQIQPNAGGQKITLNTSILGAFPESNTSDNSATDSLLVIKTQLYLPLLRRNSTP